MRATHVALAIVAMALINRPLFIWGPPGVGKSDSVRQAVKLRRAEEIAKAGLSAAAALTAQVAPLEDGTYYGLIDFRAALRDAVDIMGLPSAVDGATFYNLPAGLPHDPNWKGIVFLDEITSAPAQTQAALYQLVLDRAVGSYRLPDGARLVAAGNRVSDRGVTHRMPDPLVDRFFHVDFEAHLGDWCTWALGNGIRPEVIAFLRFRPELLHSHDTARKCTAFATPRGWEDVNKVLALNSEIEGELIRGRVGDGAAGEFMAFLKLFRGMVSPDQILLNPLGADVPTNSGILYALSEALARRSSLKNFDVVMTYAKRMPSEYAQALVSSATKLEPALCNTPDYIAWASQNL